MSKILFEFDEHHEDDFERIRFSDKKVEVEII